MSEQRNAPSAVGAAAEGEITPTPEKEQKMNDSTVVLTADVRETVRDVFVEIEQLGPIVQLLPAHLLFQQIPAEMFKTAEQLDDSEVELDLGWYFFATILDIDGAEVTTGLSEDLWDAYRSEYSLGARRKFQSTQNAAIRLGDFLVISHGEYIPIAKTALDGVAGFTVVTRQERQRLERAERDAFADEHPIIHASKPTWADRVNVDAVDDDTQEADIVYARSLGLVDLSRAAVYADGAMRFDDGTDRPFVTLMKYEDLTLAEMRELASAIMAAIPVVEAALAAEVH